MDLEDVVAELEIRRVLARYCRGVDRGDVALLKSVYHPDATDDHGTFVGSGHAFAEALVEGMDQGSVPSQHHVTNVLIEREGDRARVESYVLAFHPVPRDGGEVHALAGARYLDRFEKRDGAWKISDRRVVMDLSRAALPGEPWKLEEAFANRGGRRATDPSDGFVGDE
jgi:ketosteroid isomerase-like protein